MSNLRIPEELAGFIREEAEKAGYQLVEITTRSGNAFFVEIVIDKKGGITLDECSDFNRKIMSWMDENKMFEGGYTLDVCSPGLDRELRTEGDFWWALGKQVRVTTHEPVEKMSSIIGKLVKANEKEGITVEQDNGSTVHVDKNNVAKAKLWVSI
jgi:ribosome maturation factor RimP